MTPPTHIKARNAAWFLQYQPVHEVYLQRIVTVLLPGSVAVHLGAGRDSLQIGNKLRGVCRRFVSVDIERDGLAQNPCSGRVQASGASLPVKNRSADLVIADNVFEHLENPTAVLAECRRVLKDEGAVVFLCPNGTSYLALVSRITPHWLHAKLKKLLLGVEEQDTFATYYRLNSRRVVTDLASKTGFHVEALETYVGWPTYWEFSDTLHRVFVAVHALLEKLPPWFHITLIGVLRAGPRHGPNNGDKSTEVPRG